MYAPAAGFSLGAGRGRLTNVFAADTDLVFGILCEEWELLIAVMAVVSIACLRCSRRDAHKTPFVILYRGMRLR